jgi:hypothetical protein
MGIKSIGQLQSAFLQLRASYPTAVLQARVCSIRYALNLSYGYVAFFEN